MLTLLASICLSILTALGAASSPQAPPASVAGSVGLGGGCPSGNAEFYCTAKTDSKGCTPELEEIGCPSASAGSGWIIRVNRITSSQTAAQIIYGTMGGAQTPLAGGGFLCVRPPIERTAAVEGSGAPGVPCSNSFRIDFNAYIASGVDPALVAGQQVWLQFWYIDPQGFESNNIGLSRALTANIGI